MCVWIKSFPFSKVALENKFIIIFCFAYVFKSLTSNVQLLPSVLCLYCKLSTGIKSIMVYVCIFYIDILHFNAFLYASICRLIFWPLFDIMIVIYVFNRDSFFRSLNWIYIASGTCYIAVKYVQTLKNFEIPFINLSF